MLQFNCPLPHLQEDPSSATADKLDHIRRNALTLFGGGQTDGSLLRVIHPFFIFYLVSMVCPFHYYLNGLQDRTKCQELGPSAIHAWTGPFKGIFGFRTFIQWANILKIKGFTFHHLSRGPKPSIYHNNIIIY